MVDGVTAAVKLAESLVGAGPVHQQGPYLRAAASQEVKGWPFSR